MNEPSTFDAEVFADRVLTFFPNGVDDATQMILDDIIYEWSGSIINLDMYCDEDIEADDEEDPDVLLEISEGLASSVNNQGPREQIMVLCCLDFNPSEIIDLVKDDPRLSAHDRMELIKLGRESGRTELAR